MGGRTVERSESVIHKRAVGDAEMPPLDDVVETEADPKIGHHLTDGSGSGQGQGKGLVGAVQ